MKHHTNTKNPHLNEAAQKGTHNAAGFPQSLSGCIFAALICVAFYLLSIRKRVLILALSFRLFPFYSISVIYILLLSPISLVNIKSFNVVLYVTVIRHEP